MNAVLEPKPFHEWKDDFRREEAPVVRPREQYHELYGRYVSSVRGKSVSLRVVPVSLDTANEFVRRLHRHNGVLPGAKFAVGVESDAGLVGVAIVGNPSAPALQNGILIEIRRVCTDGTRNACSMLYAACRKAARAMGHGPVITYTLPSEGGASLRAAGFILDKTDAGGPSKAWSNRPGRNVLPIEDDLVGGKLRWRDA